MYCRVGLTSFCVWHRWTVKQSCRACCCIWQTYSLVISAESTGLRKRVLTQLMQLSVWVLHEWKAEHLVLVLGMDRSCAALCQLRA